MMTPPVLVMRAPVESLSGWVLGLTVSSPARTGSARQKSAAVVMTAPEELR